MGIRGKRFKREHLLVMIVLYQFLVIISLGVLVFGLTYADWTIGNVLYMVLLNITCGLMGSTIGALFGVYLVEVES